MIVELEPGVWLAAWRGDPGRTLVKATAKVFRSASAAERAIRAARVYRPFPNARTVGREITYYHPEKP